MTSHFGTLCIHNQVINEKDNVLPRIHFLISLDHYMVIKFSKLLSINISLRYLLYTLMMLRDFVETL